MGGRRDLIEQGIRELYPGYFALVMATGIVSIASFLVGFEWVARLLLPVNLIAYTTLCLLTLTRLEKHPADFLADLRNHVRGPGFLTLVAGTCTLGVQVVILTANPTAGLFLFALSVLLWSLLIYAFFTAVMVHQPKPDLGSGFHGGWLLAVVATQSVSVLATLLAPRLGIGQEAALFFALSYYLLGCALYLLLLSMILYRLTFFPLTPEDFTPPYWINMGGAAITTLAGATLILAAPQGRFLEEILPFLKGFTLLFWVVGTWWIPLLVLLEVWRHGYRRYPIRYDPRYWGVVFPLGMYTACTFQLGKVTGLSFLISVAHVAIYVTLLTWIATFVGLFRGLGSGLLVAPLLQDRDLAMGEAPREPAPPRRE